MNRLIILLFFILITGSCKIKTKSTDIEVKAEIQKQLDRCVQAVVTKDLKVYMDLIPEDFIIKDNSGEIISRE